MNRVSDLWAHRETTSNAPLLLRLLRSGTVDRFTIERRGGGGVGTALMSVYMSGLDAYGFTDDWDGAVVVVKEEEGVQELMVRDTMR